MSKTLAMTFACSYLSFTATFAIAADQPDKAAVKQATASCRAEVKEHAKSKRNPTKCRCGRNTKRSRSASKRLWLSIERGRFGQFGAYRPSAETPS
jgi:hypothetical protein